MESFQVRIAEQTLRALFSNEWNLISLDIICKKLKLDKKKVSKHFKNKHDLLKNINQYFDDQILKGIKSIEKSTPKDMLFEILMLRFDLLNRYRKSILRIFNIFKYQPKNFVMLLPSFINSIALMASAANIETKGIKGNIKLKGILIVYFSTFLIWIKDDNSSLDKTMNTLDNYLERAEVFLKLLEN